MGKSSLPGTRTRGRHRRVEPKTWQHATPPRVIGYAVAMFLTVIAVSSASHGTDTLPSAPGPAPQAAAQPAAQFLAPQVTATVPNLDVPASGPRLVAIETPAPTTSHAKPTTERPAATQAPETTKASKPTERTSALPEPSQPKPTPTAQPTETQQPAEPAQPTETPQPSDKPSDSAPPSASEPEPTAPRNPGPTRPGLLPGVGGVLGGLTGPLLEQ
ncbi:hypothetical protein [Saccharopolyspora phatthalungensis]|uniref:Serine/threonine-protein kinase n=1 Tax=Saccharopolyspora phatthalungensis TaxID=664693 RepID=A0A840QHS0_9PSEU|nr:hypothetical protein [Saccharopolyspora phatthalungensis]MBB5158105.1 serine/threonine-protein kinase [Saccharopolyspora phatthalungensis]